MSTQAQMFRVMCPYCTIGHAVVDVQKTAGAHQANTQPRQCSMCDRYFKIEVQLNIVGKPLEPVDRHKAFRNAIKELI